MCMCVHVCVFVVWLERRKVRNKKTPEAQESIRLLPDFNHVYLTYFQVP